MGRRATLNRMFVAAAVATAVGRATARGGTVIDRPTGDPYEGLGIGQFLWTAATSALSTATGGSVQTMSTVPSLTPLLGSSGLWVDVGPPNSLGTSGLLSAAESNTIAAYAATGRRVVLIGGNDGYYTWDVQLLNLIGDGYTGTVGPTTLQPTFGLPLTAGVNTTVANGANGTATGPGTSLFDVRTAILAGPARNVLVVLSPTLFDDDSVVGVGNVGNPALLQNVARWVAGGLPDAPCPWQAAAGGTWQAAAGWAAGNMPSAADEATFDAGTGAGYTVTVGGPVAVGTVRVVGDHVALDLTGGGMTIAGAVTVGQTAAGTLALGRSTAGGATVTAGSVLVGGAGSLTVSAGATLAVAGPVTGPVTVAAGGRLTAASVADASLTIAGGTVVVGPAAAGSGDTATALSFAGTAAAPVGQLDLTDVALTVRNGNLAAVTALVRAGFAGGTFAGPGIASSVAAADPAHLAAIGVGTAGADVVVELTTVGDANLDGVVDGRRLRPHRRRLRQQGSPDRLGQRRLQLRRRRRRLGLHPDRQRLQPDRPKAVGRPRGDPRRRGRQPPRRRRVRGRSRTVDRGTRRAASVDPPPGPPALTSSERLPVYALGSGRLRFRRSGAPARRRSTNGHT